MGRVVRTSAREGDASAGRRRLRSPMTRARIAETDARGEFDAALPCGRRRLTVLAAGFEPLANDVEVCGVDAGPLTWRLTPDDSHARHETVVRAKPVQPAMRLDERGADPDGGHDGRSAARARVAAGRGDRGLAGANLRRARLEPRQHRVLPGQHSGPRPLPPGAGPIRDSPVLFREPAVLPGRLPGPVRALRGGHRGGGHARRRHGPRSFVRRRSPVRRRRAGVGAAAGQRRRGGGRALFVHRRAGVAARRRTSASRTGTIKCVSTGASARFSSRCWRSDHTTCSGRERRRRARRRSTSWTSTFTASLCAPACRCWAAACKARSRSAPIARARRSWTSIPSRSRRSRRRPVWRCCARSRRPTWRSASTVTSPVTSRWCWAPFSRRTRPTSASAGWRPCWPATRRRLCARTGASRSPPSCASTATTWRAPTRTTWVRASPHASACARTRQSAWPAAASRSSPACRCRFQAPTDSA